MICNVVDPAVRVKLERNAEILAGDLGQLKSMEQGLPVDALGRPLPWYTYPFIEHLSSYRVDGWRVFEFGGGYSTRYWLGRGANVHAVDHDAEWLGRAAAENNPLLHAELHTEQDAYVGSLPATGGLWDVIVIDGRWRLACSAVAPAQMAPGGFIILDNSDWYPKACFLLRSKGFFQLDFSGFGPINNYTWTTSLFLQAQTRLQQSYTNPQPIGSQHSSGDDND